MKMVESIIIPCSECGENIKVTADDMIIEWRWNGACPGHSVQVRCPHCTHMSTVKQTDEAKWLLRHKINSV